MRYSPETIVLTLHVDAGADAHDDEREALAQALADELGDLDVESVERVPAAPAPPGSKPVEPVTLGVLALAVLPAILPKVIDFAQQWALRGESRTVKIRAGAGDRSIEVEFPPAAMTSDQVEKLAQRLMETATARDTGSA